MKLIFDNVIPQDAYIGYKPGSNTRTYWAWISTATYNSLQDRDLYARYFHFEDDKGTPREMPGSDGILTLRDWQQDDKYKYKDYLGFTDFYDHYCWRIDE